MKDSASIFSLEHWDLAPGEVISQSPPGRVPHALRTPVCPAPTLDIDEFIARDALSDDDCSSLDSVAEFDLAPGEIRSQVPLRTFYESEPERCLPPTLDTQGLLNDIESEAALMVEDSLPGWERIRGYRISQGPPSEPPNSLTELGPLPLHPTEFRHNGILLGEDWRVEDSQIGHVSAPGEDRQSGPDSQATNVESLRFTSPVRVPGPGPTGRVANDSECTAVSPSNRIPPVNSVMETGVMETGVMETGIMGRKESDTMASLSPVCKRSVFRCSPLDEGDHPKISNPRSPENPRDHNVEVENLEMSGPVVTPLTKHMPPTADPPTISKLKPVANSGGNVLFRISPAIKTPLTDVTNSRPPTALNSKNKASGSPTVELAQSDRSRPFEGALSISTGNPSGDHVLSTSCVRLLDKNGVAPDCGKGTEVDAGRIGRKRGRGAIVKAEFSSSLGDKKMASSRQVRQQHLRRDPEGWRGPKDRQVGRPRSRQPSLDRFLR